MNIPVSRRKIAALVVVAALVAGASVVRYQSAPVVPDPLHGNYESAIIALGTEMKTMPEAERFAVLKRYVSDPAPGLRLAAIERLAEQHKGNPETATILEGAYRDSASIVRQKVIETLPDVDKERGYRLLLAALRDEDYWMRDASVTALKFRARAKDTFVDERAVPSLIAVLDDERDYVSSTAVALLKKRTGNDWGYKSTTPRTEKNTVHAKWKAWAKAQNFTDSLPKPIVPSRADAAPRYALRDIDGKHFDTASSHGKVVLINFWGTWCPPCQAEIPDLVKLDAAYRGRVQIIGVAIGERSGADGLRKWCRAHNVSYTQTLATAKVQHDFGDIDEVPVSVLIDGAGRIRRRYEGERDFATFRSLRQYSIQLCRVVRVQFAPFAQGFERGIQYFGGFFFRLHAATGGSTAFFPLHRVAFGVIQAAQLAHGATFGNTGVGKSLARRRGERFFHLRRHIIRRIG